MILGMSTAAYTFFHVLISLVGLSSGLIVMFGFLTGKRLDGRTALFLTTTVATSVTGLGFPFDHFCRRTKSASSHWSFWRLRSRHATCSVSPVRGVLPMWSALLW